MTLADAAGELVRLGTVFHRRGWMLGTSGNLSAVLSRDPFRAAITASSVDKGRMSPTDILEINEDAQPLGAAQGHPSAETLLHLEVMRSTGAAAVMHTHSVWTTVLSDYHHARGGFFVEGYEMLKGLDGIRTHEHREWIPILENTQDMAALAREARQLLSGQRGVRCLLVRRHGMYTWGTDVNSAARHVEILEFLFEAVGRRQMMEPSTAD